MLPFLTFRVPGGCSLCAQYRCRESFFFQWLVPFLDDPKRLVLVGGWNAIIDPKIDKVRRGPCGAERCESSLIDLIAWHDLVDRFRLDHPRREMWTWLDSSPSTRVGSYLDGALVRRADSDFLSCPTFHLLGLTDLLGTVCG